MLLVRSLLCALLPVLSFAAPAAPRAPVSPQTLWTRSAGTIAYAAPRLDTGVLASIPPNQTLRVVATAVGWGRILLWNALPAYVPLASLQDAPTPYTPQSTARPQVPYAGAHAPLPLVARGDTRMVVNMRAAPVAGITRVALLPSHLPLSIDAWATDATGAAWYHATALPARPGGRASAGWVYGDAVTFDAGASASPPAVLAPLHGKGLWFTYSLLRTSPITAIIATARAAGISHLYVEVMRSNEGFYGARGLAALLPAAHRAGIRVIVWVYPYLHNLPYDVATTLAAARYTAPSGDRPDGLLTDVEENMDEGAVRAYGQVLRAALGPHALMSIATYPPQWAAGRAYPFATAALSWNAIVPMDYWHVRRRAYSADEVYQFVRDSVALIRMRTRPNEPVEVLGQMFDVYQSGVDSPSAAEIIACAAAARDTNALGLSFFEWRHATPEEWSMLARLPVAHRGSIRNGNTGARRRPVFEYPALLWVRGKRGGVGDDVPVVL